MELWKIHSLLNCPTQMQHFLQKHKTSSFKKNLIFRWKYHRKIFENREYLDEYESKIETTLACVSGAYMELNDEKKTEVENLVRLSL